MQEQSRTLSAACEAGLCGLRPCKGTVHSIAYGDQPCGHDCHHGGEGRG